MNTVGQEDLWTLGGASRKSPRSCRIYGVSQGPSVGGRAILALSNRGSAMLLGSGVAAFDA